MGDGDLSLADRLRGFSRRALIFGSSRLDVHRRRHRPVQLVWERAAHSSADFIESHLSTAVLFDHREDLWRHALKQMPAEGLILEFGVFEGQSINFVADWLKAKGDRRRVHGFDSFEGLEEDWSGEALPAGFFDQGGRMPPVRESVTLVKGWIENTLPPFLAEQGDAPVALIHIDTDTYTPAKLVLSTLKSRMRPGSIVIFDELVGYPNWQAHEYRALVESFGETGYRFLSFTSRQCAIMITD